MFRAYDLRCGRLGRSLLLENFMAMSGEAGTEAPTPMMVDGKSGDGGGCSRLGSRLVTSRIR